MTQIHIAEELRKRGFKLTHLPSPTPEQMEHIQKISKDVNKFLKMMKKAYKVSEKSTLRFSRSGFIVARHEHRRHPSFNIQRQR